MKFRLVIPFLVAAFSWGGSGSCASAADWFNRQDSPPARQELPLTAKQELPEEKKKSLHRLGPDELFPGGEQDRTPPESPRPLNRRRAAPKPMAAPANPEPILPVASPGALGSQDPQQIQRTPTSSSQLASRLPVDAPFEQRPSTAVELSALGFLSLGVLIGLCYVLAKLREMLGDGG